VSPLNKCGHDFLAKTLSVRAFLEPKADFGRNRIRIFQRGHAKAFPVVKPPDDERKLVWFRSLHSLLASRHVLAPRWRLPWHESGDGGRDASKNLLCIHYLKLAELQSWGLDDNHCVSLSTTDNTPIDENLGKPGKTWGRDVPRFFDLHAIEVKRKSCRESAVRVWIRHSQISGPGRLRAAPFISPQKRNARLFHSTISQELKCRGCADSLRAADKWGRICTSQCSICWGSDFRGGETSRRPTGP